MLWTHVHGLKHKTDKENISLKWHTLLHLKSNLIRQLGTLVPRSQSQAPG